VAPTRARARITVHKNGVFGSRVTDRFKAAFLATCQSCPKSDSVAKGHYRCPQTSVARSEHTLVQCPGRTRNFSEKIATDLRKTPRIVGNAKMPGQFLAHSSIADRHPKRPA